MFESAEIGHRIDKKDYKQREPKLRSALLDAHHELLHKATRPVIVLVNGVDGAGKGETVNLFNEWTMQDTLGNVLGGVALQLDNSLRVGD